MNQPAASGGLFKSLSNLAVTLLAMGQARLELLGNEFETQRLRTLRMLVLAQAMAFTAALGTLLLVMLVTLLLWEQRIAVVAVFTVLFLGAALWLYRSLMTMLNDPQPPFAATLAELDEDLRRLQAVSGHAKSPD